ncbi:MAG: aspartyl protease family protein [Saprospiraceae bacterium]|nr:aspartyl protease family protein [Saprospiraceae bacterium]
MKKLKSIFIFLFLSGVLFAQREVALLETSIPANLYVYSATTPMEVDFEIINGLIVIAGAMEGEVGSFILDTGAPGLIVNEKTEADPSLEANGIGGDVAVGQRFVESLQWAGLELEHIHGYAIDMSHLASSIDRNLLGLVGFELLDGYEILLDYSNRKLLFFPLGSGPDKFHTPKAVIPFQMQQHLPVVKVKIGNKKYRFGIDCGASVNLIHDRYQEKLAPLVENACCTGFLRGLDGTGEMTSIVTFKDVSIGGEAYNQGEFQWTSFRGISGQDLQIDGLLGAGFFVANKVSINYKDQKIYLW